MDANHISSWPAAAVALGGVAYFAAIYLAAGLIASGVRVALLRSGRGRLLDPRPVPPGQVAREWRQSAASIVIFGVGLLLPWAMVVRGWADVAPSSPPLHAALELLVLLVWNDIHCYAVHRTLHQPMLLWPFTPAALVLLPILSLASGLAREARRGGAA